MKINSQAISTHELSLPPMLATASFLKQLLHEKLLLLTHQQSSHKKQRGTTPHQRIFRICPPQNDIDQISVKLSPVVKQMPEKSTGLEKPNFLLTPFAASNEEYTVFINKETQPMCFKKHGNSSRAEVYFNCLGKNLKKELRVITVCIPSVKS